jgi:hypothetical protein
MQLPKVLTTSVVRGARQGQSHGGVYLVDLESDEIEVMLDWNTSEINFTGRGADRGLRGIAFDGNEIYIAASDEIFVFDKSFKILRSFRNRYLKHCHEIAIYKDQLFLTSTGYDSILVFNIRSEEFVWGVHVQPKGDQVRAHTFDPMAGNGPLLRTQLHLNGVFCNSKAVMMSGMRFDRLFRFRADGLSIVAKIPRGTHNVQLHKKGLLYCDTANDCIRYIKGGESKRYSVPQYRENEIINSLNVSDRVARPHFARGLCTWGDDFIIAGSSPSTIAVHNLVSGEMVKRVNLSMDVRNAIHGLAIWPTSLSLGENQKTS